MLEGSRAEDLGGMLGGFGADEQQRPPADSWIQRHHRGREAREQMSKPTAAARMLSGQGWGSADGDRWASIRDFDVFVNPALAGAESSGAKHLGSSELGAGSGTRANAARVQWRTGEKQRRDDVQMHVQLRGGDVSSLLRCR